MAHVYAYILMNILGNWSIQEITSSYYSLWYSCKSNYKKMQCENKCSLSRLRRNTSVSRVRGWDLAKLDWMNFKPRTGDCWWQHFAWIACLKLSQKSGRPALFYIGEPYTTRQSGTNAEWDSTPLQRISPGIAKPPTKRETQQSEYMHHMRTWRPRQGC